MYKENDYVIYKKNVCRIKEIRKNNGVDYYILVPIDDNSLTIELPVDNECFLKNIMNKKEALDLINNIPNIEPLDNIDDKNIERTYKELLINATHEDLIKIIKTSYLRNDTRLKNNKKLSEKDSIYFKQAEKYLYNEISIALNMSFDETKEYIINKVKELENK